MCVMCVHTGFWRAVWAQKTGMTTSPRSGEPQVSQDTLLGSPLGRKYPKSGPVQNRVTLATQIKSWAFLGKRGWDLEALQLTAQHNLLRPSYPHSFQPGPVPTQLIQGQSEAQSLRKSPSPQQPRHRQRLWDQSDCSPNPQPPFPDLACGVSPPQPGGERRSGLGSDKLQCVSWRLCHLLQDPQMQ